MFEPSSLFAIMVILAAISDIFFRRIPNFINFSLLLSGLLVAVLGWGQIGLLDSLLGVGVCLGVLLVPFALQVYRGGDVKLCMGMSAWLGAEQGLWVIGLGVLGGGILGLMMLVLNLATRRNTRKSTVPMAVCFTIAGLWVERFGIPF